MTRLGLPVVPAGRTQPDRSASILPSEAPVLAVKAEPPPHIDDLWDSDAEQRRLLDIWEGAFTRVLRAVHAVVARSFPQATNFRLDDPATRRMLQQAAHRVVRIDEATRQAIAEVLQVGQERGYSAWQIAHGVPDEEFGGIDKLFKETWRNRADVVARTELQEAQRLSALDRYNATGLVDRVLIRDGDDDEVCSNRDGKTVPIEQAPGLAHPNCRLVLVPVLREGIA